MRAMPFSSSPPEQSVAIRPAAHRVWSSTPWVLACAALVYASIVLLAVLTLNPYFAQTWDVATFIQAAHRFLDGGTPFDLYAQSRSAQTWPYAYPPFHALAVAIALVANTGHLLPEYVAARLPALLADLAVGLVLYRIVRNKSDDPALPLVALLVWLFNPVTFYDTAVQGHFESEWILFVLLAYMAYEESRSVGRATLALAVAVLFKQVAILFAIPFWLALLLREGPPAEAKVAGLVPPRLRRLFLSLGLFALVTGVVSLPFLLYSNDFLFMNFSYVENVPVQTQSWIVALLGLTRAAPDALNSDFFLLRYQTLVTMLVALGIAVFGIRRGWDLYLTGLLIALAFFLTSKKVMGYYYVMLVPFLLAVALPQRRFRLVLATLLAVTWISLSPYYAAWTNHDHWWVYALLGTANSLFFLWLTVRLISHPAAATARPGQEGWDEARLVAFVALGLFAGAALGAFLQPALAGSGSPIRPPLVAPGTEGRTAAALLAILALQVVALAGLARWTAPWVPGRIPRAAWGIVLALTPLFFAVYSLTKESTALFEIALKTLGV